MSSVSQLAMSRVERRNSRFASITERRHEYINLNKFSFPRIEIEPKTHRISSHILVHLRHDLPLLLNRDIEMERRKSKKEQLKNVLTLFSMNTQVKQVS